MAGQLRSPLLWRFLESNAESAESYRDRVKQDILDNVKNILSTTHPPALAGLATSSESHLSQSVLNYGVPSFVGNVATEAKAESLREGIRQAILAHEPRLDRATLCVDVIKFEEEDGNMLDSKFGFEINAQISVLTSDNAFVIETRVNPFRVPEILER